jgi:DNA-cytosine methyltransferase
MRRQRTRYDDIKRRLRQEIERYIRHHCPKKDALVFLSGGADSTLIALAAHHTGKRITALSFRIGGVDNPDCIQARKTSKAMGWKCHVVNVSTNAVGKSFVGLFEKYGCRTKTEAECLFSLLPLISKAIKLGYSSVLTGFGSFIPDDRKSNISYHANPKAYWESLREDLERGKSRATKKIAEIFKAKGLQILMPLFQESVIDCLEQLTPKELWGTSYQKQCYKDLYFDDFERLGMLRVRNKSLQIAANVEAIFAQLLDDPAINFAEYKSGAIKTRLSALCMAWGKRAIGHTSGKKCRRETSGLAEQRRASFKAYTLQDVIQASNADLFKVVSTFAGGGGSSTGYWLAGGKVLFVNGFIKTAADTYALNYPDTPVVITDIRKLNVGSEYVRNLFGIHKIEKGQLDILDGSPPCSTFSVAGKGKAKIEERNVIYSETRQSRVGMLIHDFVFMANVMQPKVCIIENVPGIKKSEVFQYACDRLRHWGYLVNFDILTSSAFGVPQRRKRLFALAVRGDITKNVGFTNDEDLLSVYPSGSADEVTVRDALAGIAIDPEERDMLLVACRKGPTYELLKQIPMNPPKQLALNDIVPEWKSDFNLIRASWDQPCPTITATGAQITRGGLHHPCENRLFTIAELKRLMALPDDFRFTGSFNQKVERIGRMVPPLMTKALASAVYEKILSRI